MKKFIEKIHIHRDKEDNMELYEIGEENGFSDPRALLYVGYEMIFEVEFSEDNKHKVLKIDNIDVSDKNIYI